MNTLDVARKYFEAWNSRDPSAIVATFAEGGTYTDPASGGALTGQALAEYTGGLFSAFPDLSFDVVSVGFNIVIDEMAHVGFGVVALQQRLAEAS